jgi:hypothetical protein
MTTPDMSHIRRVTAALFAAVFLVPAPLTAQAAGGESVVAGSYGVGLVSFGALNQPADERPAVGLSDGWIMTGSIEQRFGLVGGRASIGFTQRPFEGRGEALDINAWMGDAGVILHPLAAVGVPFSPFATAGLGFVRYGFGTGDPIVMREAEAIYPGEEQARWTWTAGGGVDIAVPALSGATPIAIRGEFQHQAVQQSHFTDLEGAWHGPVSNQRFTLGLLAFVH